MKLSDNSHGFTLMELLVVLLIMGILAAIAFPNYLRYIQKVRECMGRQKDDPGRGLAFSSPLI